MDALIALFSQKIDEEMDALWKSGEMNDEKQEFFKNGHQRSPYQKSGN